MLELSEILKAASKTMLEEVRVNILETNRNIESPRKEILIEDAEKNQMGILELQNIANEILKLTGWA